MISSSISGITFISVPGMVAEKSFSYLQMNLEFVVGQFTIAFVLVPLFYRMNVVSIYEYLENRFGMSSYKTGAWFFFISENVRSFRTVVFSLCGIAIIGFRTIAYSFHFQCCFYDRTRLAIHFSRRSKNTDLDRYLEVGLLNRVIGTLHLFLGKQPELHSCNDGFVNI